MSNISALLNPAPAGDADPTSVPSRPGSQDQHSALPNTFEAADALTALATLSSGQQYAPQRELPSPTVSYPIAPRRQSALGIPAAPIEPSPPIDQPTAHSPTLDQYHHGSKSPEEQRRQSLLAAATPPTVLAPIQSLTSLLHEQTNHESKLALTGKYEKADPILPSQLLPSPDDSCQDQNSGSDFAAPKEQLKPEVATNTDISISGQIQLEESRPSPAPIIKDEPVGTREATPTYMPTTPDQMLDPETLKAIETVKHSELGLRTNKRNESGSHSTPAAEPAKAPAASKKRPAPKSTAAANKKGTAAKKPIAKKRKLDPETMGDVRRSGTPKALKSSKKESQSGTPVADMRSSPAPLDNSSQVHSDEEESSDDGTLYCICRKPDNHQWMIACDGGCEDWFHGACVNILRADENLIDKYICPNCEAEGKGRTTWKPMCRREGCRAPARLHKGQESKYCSSECGEDFFRQQLQRTAGAKRLLQQQSRSKRKPAKDDDESDEEPPLGGVLRAKDIKTLAIASKDIEAFRRLGSGVLSPPRTASPTRTTFDSVPKVPELALTPTESAHLAALNTEKKDLLIRLELLRDRGRFVSLARDHATRLAEKNGIKPKEFCGYDARLTWSDAEFSHWRRSKTGRAAFQFNTISPTHEQIAAVEKGEFDVDEDEMDLVNGDRIINGDDSLKEKIEGICTKKRCNKHVQWQKLNLQDARFEELEVVEAMRTCEKEEKDVRERVARRTARQVVEGELLESSGLVKPEKNREGWVEVVEV